MRNNSHSLHLLDTSKVRAQPGMTLTMRLHLSGYRGQVQRSNCDEVCALSMRSLYDIISMELTFLEFRFCLCLHLALTHVCEAIHG